MDACLFFKEFYTLTAMAAIQFGDNNMNLIDVVKKIQTFNEDHTIYSEYPWSPDSISIVIQEPDDGGLPDQAKELGLSYFLEIFVAKDFIDDWEVGLVTEPTLEKKCSRLIEYAIRDA